MECKLTDRACEPSSRRLGVRTTNYSWTWLLCGWQRACVYLAFRGLVGPRAASVGVASIRGGMQQPVRHYQSARQGPLGGFFPAGCGGRLHPFGPQGAAQCDNRSGAQRVGARGSARVQSPMCSPSLDDEHGEAGVWPTQGGQCGPSQPAEDANAATQGHNSAIRAPTGGCLLS